MTTLEKLQAHIASMAAHQKERMGGKLLIESRDRIKALERALKYYADPKIYVSGEYGCQLVAPVELDKGDTAKTELQ